MSLLDDQNRRLYEAARERDRLLARVKELEAALRTANDMVCRHSMPHGWTVFQEKHRLPPAWVVVETPTASVSEQQTSGGAHEGSSDRNAADKGPVPLLSSPHTDTTPARGPEEAGTSPKHCASCLARPHMRGCTCACSVCQRPSDAQLDADVSASIKRVTRENGELIRNLAGERTEPPKASAPLPHVTVSYGEVSDDELCLEWWFGAADKITVYAKPTTVFRKHGEEEADPPSPKTIVEWLRDAQQKNPPTARTETPRPWCYDADQYGVVCSCCDQRRRASVKRSETP